MRSKTVDADRILCTDCAIPIFQNLKMGDLIPLTRTGRIRVGILEPDRFLVLFFPGNAIDGGFRGATWATGLHRIGPSETRMVTRIRARPIGTMERAFMDLYEIVMMRKHMLGVKKRAVRLSSTTAAERREWQVAAVTLGVSTRLALSVAAARQRLSRRFKTMPNSSNSGSTHLAARFALLAASQLSTGRRPVIISAILIGEESYGYGTIRGRRVP